jgi:hypothetical protein
MLQALLSTIKILFHMKNSILDCEHMCPDSIGPVNNSC